MAVMNRKEFVECTARMLEMRAAAEEEVRRITAVIGFGVGVRERNGMLTGEPAFRVYVDRKRAASGIPRNQLIPKKLLGLATDVIQLGVAQRTCCKQVVIGGIEIAVKENDLQSDNGTLGCFITLPDKRVVMLSNEHVLESNKMLRTDWGVYETSVSDKNKIGTVLTTPIGTQSLAGDGNYLDCAVALPQGTRYHAVIRKVSNSTSGRKEAALKPGVKGKVFVNDAGLVVEIQDENGAEVDTTKIAGEYTGSRAALSNVLVWKVGRTTDLTAGVVTDVDFKTTWTERTAKSPTVEVPFTQTTGLLVDAVAGPIDPEWKCTLFLNKGDSGSVCMDLQNRVIGLLHHKIIPDPPVAGQGAGTHIGAVLSYFGGATVVKTNGTVKVTAARSNTLARDLWIEQPPATLHIEEVTRQLRSRLAQCQRGRELLALLDRHGAEILDLVDHRRAVTTTWHRHHGPAFVALLARGLAEPHKPLPLEVEGVARRSLVIAMVDALAKYGSSTLRVDIDEHRAWLFDLLAESKDLGEALEQIERSAA